MSFTDLSQKELIVISKLGQLIKKETGIHIDLTQDNLMQAIAQAMQKVSDVNALALYQQLIKTEKTDKETPDTVETTQTTTKGKKMYRGQVIE